MKKDRRVQLSEEQRLDRKNRAEHRRAQGPKTKHTPRDPRFYAMGED